MCPFIRRLEEYGLSAYRPGIFNTKLTSIEEEINFEEFDYTPSEQLQDLILSSIYIIVSDKNKFLKITKLEETDVEFPPLLFFNAQLSISNEEENLSLIDFGPVSEQLIARFFQYIDKHFTYYKSAYPDLMMKRLFDKKEAEHLLLETLSIDRNRINQNELFKKNLSQLYQLLTEDIQSIMDTRTIKQ